MTWRRGASSSSNVTSASGSVRVLLDTNVLISNLHSARPATSATGVLLRAALTGGFTLLVVQGVVDELLAKLRDRPDLSTRIAPEDAQDLIMALRVVAESVPLYSEPYPEIGRDRKDDFLIAHAVLAAADYLVSWDQDLLDLGTVGNVKIVSPPAFLDVLRAARLL
jgi:uncharacterized protein